MTVILQRRNDDTDELEPMARIDGGQVIRGKDRMEDLLVDGEVPTEDELLDRFRGPTLFAGRVDGDTAEAGSALRSPLEDVPVLPSDAERITQDDLITWVKWVQLGRPDTSQDVKARDFNPSLHPRGPDGKFVERPWDLPDDLLDDIDDLRTIPTADLLDSLEAHGEPINEVLADSDIQIDGIPDDVNSVSEAKERLGGDGLTFQDLEVGDSVTVVDDNTGALRSGSVEKTEQIDGAPNRVHLTDSTGMHTVADVPDDGTATITRDVGPVKPPTAVATQDPLAPSDIQPGRKVSVVGGYSDSVDGPPKHEVTGTVSATEDDIQGMDAIEVDGNTYAPGHQNIQIFDAEPDPVSVNDLSVGDDVKAFEGMASTEGTVQKINDVDGGKIVIIQPDGGGATKPFGSTTADFFKPQDAVMSDNVVDETQDIQDDQDLPNLDLLSPGDVDVEDIPDENRTSMLTQPHAIDEGDWVVFDGPELDNTPGGAKVGTVEAISSAGENAMIEYGEGGIGDPSAGNTGIVDINLFTQDTLDRVDMDPDMDADDDNIDIGTGPDDEESPDFADLDDLTLEDAPQIAPADIPEARKDNVWPDEAPALGPGDWVQVETVNGNTSIGRVSQMTDGPETTEGLEVQMSTSFSDVVEPSDVEDMWSIDENTEVRLGPDVSDIDPSTVSHAEVNDDNLQGIAAWEVGTKLRENDFVTYKANDGFHAGKVTKVTDTSLQVNTGHASDPQTVDATDMDARIDPSYVADVGDEAGQATPKTSANDAPDSDLSLDDVKETPDTGTITEDDLNHPASSEGVSDVGMVDQDQVEAFYELMEDPDQGQVDVFEPKGDRDTKNKGMTYPQGNPYKLRDHIGFFANEALDAQNGNDAAESLLSQVGSWKGKSYTNTGQTIERRFHAALDLPGDFRDDGLMGQKANPDEAKTAALATAATQEFIRRNFDAIDQADDYGFESDDGEIPLYRGVGKNAVASLARDWADDPEADSITANESKITNFSTDADLATSWGERDVVLKKNATPDDVVFSPDLMTGDETGIDNEGEIWLTGGVDATDPSNIQVRKQKVNQDRMTMADMMVPPEDMAREQLRILGKWAEAMRKRDYTLDTQEQIETFQRLRDEIDDNMVLSSTLADRVDEVIADSQVELNQADGPSAAPADD